MKKATLLSKTYPMMSRLLLLLLFLSGYWSVQAQKSGSATVVKNICNGDGILAVEFSGMQFPVNITYSYTNGGFITHEGVTIGFDTLKNIYSPVSFVTIQHVPMQSPDDTISIEVSMGTSIGASTDSIHPAICPNQLGYVHLSLWGTGGPYTVEWFADPFGAKTPVGSGQGISLPGGEYGYRITASDGCIRETGDSSGLKLVSIPSESNLNFNTPVTTANCTNGTAAVTDITGGNAPFIYQWSNGSTDMAINGLTAGLYSVKVTDADGCYALREVYVEQTYQIAVNPVVTHATCVQSDGKVMSFASGGVPPYTYHYSNGMSGQNITGLSGGQTYYIYVKDANGCLGSGYAYVSVTTPINVTYNTVKSSCTAPTGEATLTPTGGTTPYNVSWSTHPVQTGNTLSNVNAGQYAFKVEDAAGCLRTGVVSIESTSTLNLFIAPNNPVCPDNTGDILLEVFGTNPPFTYSWNNGATTEDLSQVQLGYYSCTITDGVGCKQTKGVELKAESPVKIGLATTPASCIYNSDGEIHVRAEGGTAPYTYSWSGGQSGPDINGLPPGGYYVFAKDANGCSAHDYSTVGYNPDGDDCYCTITGRVYQDENANCVFDSGEKGIHNIMIHCSGFGYAFTNDDGVYTFKVPTGSYTLSESVQYIYPLAACQNNSNSVSVTAASGCVTTVDFANEIRVLHDVKILRSSCRQAVPGNDYVQALVVSNEGTVIENNLQLGFRHDGQLLLSSITSPAYVESDPVNDPTWYSVSSGFPILEPGQSEVVYFNYNVPTNIPINTVLLYKDTACTTAPISEWVNDYSPWNNVRDYFGLVVGSYDPNFKEVAPAGKGAEGFIATTDSVLEYVVHFQNSGTYYAEKVVIVDTLDTDLDWSTLKPGYSDHSYTATVTDNGVLVFTFNNIHLPWQSMTEMGSRGMVTYSIKQKAGLVPLTEIRNKAGIYFDYNEPVITNEVLNTIVDNTGITENKKTTTLGIYPNPANDEIYLKLDEFAGATSINVFDIQGRKMMSVPVTKTSSVQKLSLSELVKGLYIIEVQNDKGGKISGKVVKN